MGFSGLRLPISFGLISQATTCVTVAWLAILCCPCRAQTVALADSARAKQPYDVAVRGRVVNPGRLGLLTKMTGTAALQAAGGFLPNADTDHVVIKHRGEIQGLPFNYKLAQQHPDDPKVNPVLTDGDMIVVLAVAPAFAFTISGPGIRNPAEYALDTPTISLAAAISKAGGLEELAQMDQVQILRTGANHAMTTITLNAADLHVQATYQVQSGDSIVIGQGKRKPRVNLLLPPQWPGIPRG